MHFDLSGYHRQRQPLLGTYREALLDRFLHVCLRFLFRPPLTDTAWDRGALGDEDAILILRNGNHEFHMVILTVFYGERHPLTMWHIPYDSSTTWHHG